MSFIHIKQVWEKNQALEFYKLEWKEELVH